MEYSAPTPVSKGLVSPSPRSPLLACANGNVLEIHHTHTSALHHSITTAAPITHLSWAFSQHHGELVAAASAPTNCVVIVAAESGTVLSDILDTPLRISSVHFSPGLSPVLAVLYERGVALNIFCPFRAVHLGMLPLPKLYRSAWVHDFSACGNMLVTVSRKKGRDTLCIIACKTAQVLRSMRLDENIGINDIVGIKCLRNNAGIVVWGSPTDHEHSYAFLSWSGRIMFHHSPEAHVPSRITSVRSVKFNGAHSIMAICAFDDLLSLIDIHRWALIKQFAHRSPDISELHPPIVYRERSKSIQNSENSPPNSNASRIPRARRSVRSRSKSASKEKKKAVRASYFEIVNSENEVEITKRVRTFSQKSTAIGGVSMCEFAPNGRYIATRTESASNVVYVWDVLNLCLSTLLILEQDVTCFKWSNVSNDPKRNIDDCQLAIVCGGDCLYLWKAGGAASLNVSDHIRWRSRFCARKVEWLHDNTVVVVTDGVSAKAFLTVFVTTPSAVGE
ncbi:WD40/YVTN repeat-like containing protein [Gracilaria domingensis]|nr:WD40/YVTN repeat-like containing protein [Gracilaria domingensis]